MKVAELEAPLLDFWVAKSEGLERRADAALPGEASNGEAGTWHPGSYHPATDWSQGGPIVSKAWFDIEGQLLEWFGPRWAHMRVFAEAPLKWFMRAYVASIFGDEVEDIDD